MKKHATTGCAALVLIAHVSGCSGAGVNPVTSAATASSSETPTATKTVTVTAKPTPSTIATTGSYQADLTSLGVVPDNLQSFADFMKKQICDQTGTDLGVSVRSLGGNETGGGVKGVRLTVAYFCPNKSQEVESYLDYYKK